MNWECVEDYEWYGICIFVGFEVIVFVYFIYWDVEVWFDLEKFNFERFWSLVKDSCSLYYFMFFGFGLRSCIGMRFVLMEVKIILVRFLMKYKIVWLFEI